MTRRGDVYMLFCQTGSRVLNQLVTNKDKNNVLILFIAIALMKFAFITNK